MSRDQREPLVGGRGGCDADRTGHGRAQAREQAREQAQVQAPGHSGPRAQPPQGRRGVRGRAVTGGRAAGGGRATEPAPGSPRATASQVRASQVAASQVAALDVRDLQVRLGGRPPRGLRGLKGPGRWPGRPDSTAAAAPPVVAGVDLRLAPGRTLGLVGASGAGKSTIASAIIGLLPPRAVATGSVRVGGQELLGLSDAALSRYRGRDLGMVFQDPAGALTPVLRVGDQIGEAVRVHGGSRRAARARTAELLALVGLGATGSGAARRIRDAYPHELSGGQRQRVAIAIAIANSPGLVIADEPTSALDAGVQAQVLDVLLRATRQTGSALLLITHDLGVVAAAADDVAVLDAGRIVEQGPVAALYAAPGHPVTRALLAATPRRSAPAPGTGAAGASSEAAGTSSEAAGTSSEAAGAPGDAACAPGDAAAAAPETDAAPGPPQVLLRVRGLTVDYAARVVDGVARVVDGVDLDVGAGECLALVGESGAGKTTILRRVMDALAGIATTDARVGGSITWGTTGGTTWGQERPARAQLVFQDASAALDPRMTVADSLRQAMRAARPGGSATGDRRAVAAREQARAVELLGLVDLGPQALGRHPWQLSGGELQRVGIARALAADPALLLLDEPVSALDVLVRVEIIDLLARLRARLGLAYLLVAHDLAVVRRLADRVAVLSAGRVVEVGPAASVLGAPQHPGTRALVAAVLPPDPRRCPAGDPPAGEPRRM